MYNDQAPERAIGIFDACSAAQRRGNGLYIQIPCQPLSFDFTMANAYPFYSHAAFDPIKAYTPEQLMAVFRDSSWRARFRDDLRNPRPGMIFQGNWERVMVAVTHKPANARYVNRLVSDIAVSEGRDPLDVVLDLSLDEDLRTAFLGKFLNVGDDGVARLLKHEAGVVALSDAGAHLIYMCDAGFGLHFLAHWVRERGDFDLAEGVRRLTSHPAGLYGIPDRGRIAVGAHADLLLFDPKTVGVTPAERLADLPGGGRRTIRRPTGVHGVYCNGVRTFDGSDYVRHAKGPGAVLDRFNLSSGTHLAQAAQ
jgi:N-acyl-D-aspartate/D-glutamate deacylase